MPTSRCPPSCSHRHGAAPCACPADRRRPLSAPLSVHQPGSPGRGIKDRVWAQERTTASCGTERRNPQPVAFWTRSSAVPASTDAARGIVRANYDCDSFVLRTAAPPPLARRGWGWHGRIVPGSSPLAIPLPQGEGEEEKSNAHVDPWNCAGAAAERSTFAHEQCD